MTTIAKNAEKTVYISFLDDDLRAYVSQLLGFAGLEISNNADDAALHILDKPPKVTVNGPVFVVHNRDAGIEDGVGAAFDVPLRAGLFLDALRLYLFGATQDFPAHIQIQNYDFQPADCLLRDQATDQDIKLTEKERDILFTLYQKQDAYVTRTDLLRLIWGYVDGLETHTLETHFYRLRQKIETDPSQPEILLTSDEGYTLKA